MTEQVTPSGGVADLDDLNIDLASISARVDALESAQGGLVTDLSDLETLINASANEARGLFVPQALRPGGEPNQFTTDLTGAPGSVANLLDSPALSVSSETSGRVLLVTNSAATVALRTPVAIQSDRVYRLHAYAQRLSDSNDPAGDALEIGIQGLRGDYTAGNQIVIDQPTITVGDGVVGYTATFAKSGGLYTPDHSVQNQNIYLRPFVIVHGGRHVTAVIQIDLIDITDAAQVAGVPDATALNNAVQAAESYKDAAELARADAVAAANAFPTVTGADPAFTLEDNSGGQQADFSWGLNPFDDDGVTQVFGKSGQVLDGPGGRRLLEETDYTTGSKHHNYALRSNSYGAEFNVINYILDQPGGRAQVDLIMAGDHASQDATIVTAGIHAAVADWWRSGSMGKTLLIPPGTYRVNDEILAADVNGESVSKRISDGEVNNDPVGITPGHMIDASPMALIVCYENEWTSSDVAAGHFVDPVLIRWQNSNKDIGAIFARLPRGYWVGGRSTKYQCPTFAKFRQVNGLYLDLNGPGPRGQEWSWPGGGVYLDSVNNSRVYNGRIKAGFSPLAHSVFDASGERFNIDQSGARIVEGGSLTRFSPPAGYTGDGFFVGLLALVGEAGTADRQLVEINNHVNGNAALNLTTELRLDQDYTNVHVSFQFPTCSVTSGSNQVVFDQPILTSDMEGRLIFIEAARDNMTNSGVMVAYIGSVVDSTTCLLVGEGGALANFGETKSLCSAWFSAGFSLHQVYASTYDGQNDEVTIYGLTAEKSNGCQIFIQRSSGTKIFQTKGHGRASNGGASDMDFTRHGLCFGFDNCRKLSISGCKMSWAGFIDPVRKRTCYAKVYGGENNIEISAFDPFGVNNITDLINVFDAGNNTLITLSGGENGINNWKATGNDHEVLGLSGTGSQVYANMLACGLPIKVENTSSGNGFDDMLAPYRHAGMVDELTISNGEVTATGRRIIIVDTEGGAATDDLTTINGLPEGFEGILAIKNSGRKVTLIDDTGNIQTRTGEGDHLMDKPRDPRRFVVIDGFIRFQA